MLKFALIGATAALGSSLATGFLVQRGTIPPGVPMFATQAAIAAAIAVVASKVV